MPIKKKALIMGLNYRNTSSELRGCINDTVKLNLLLTDKFNYSENDITIMTDDHSGDLYPNRDNIINQLDTLVNQVINDNLDEIWISYSGHGSYSIDSGTDEKDGKDETICPLDYSTSGVISDDTIREYLERVPSFCNVICLFDSCHSGTIVDLKHHYIFNKTKSRKKTVKQRVRRRVKKGRKWRFVNKLVKKTITVPGTWNWDSSLNSNYSLNSQVISISGCRDHQVSFDVYSQEFGIWGGALTNAFIKIIRECQTELSPQDLCLKLNQHMLEKKYTQKPQICSSYPIRDNYIFYRNMTDTIICIN